MPRHTNASRWLALVVFAVTTGLLVALCLACAPAPAPAPAVQLAPAVVVAEPPMIPAPPPGFIYLPVPVCEGDSTGVRTLTRAGRTWLHNPAFGDRRYVGDSLRILFIDCDDLLRRPAPWHAPAVGRGHS